MEEVTGSLLRVEGGLASSQEEEEGEGEACTHQWLQSTLHCINMSVQQVSP